MLSLRSENFRYGLDFRISAASILQRPLGDTDFSLQQLFKFLPEFLHWNRFAQNVIPAGAANVVHSSSATISAQSDLISTVALAR
jgi:hypothetical protein